jgi:single-strand DNA-binding protein
VGFGGTATGTIYSIEQTQQVTDNFRKRAFVLTWPDGKDAKGQDRYQFVEFQVTGRKCEDMDRWAEGEIVTVTYDLRGRVGKSRVFNALEAWKIEPAGDASSDRKQTREREQRQELRPAERPAPAHDYRDEAPPPDDPYF